jgi:hypothetical protein
MGAARTSKAGLMLVLLCVDLAMNCSFDYDNLGLSDKVDFLVVVLGVQVVVEISVFLALFLAMAETFLFRVGLLGLLVKKFRLVLLVHPLYLALTIAAGTLRVRRLAADGDVAALQRDSSFVAVSAVQKIGTASPPLSACLSACLPVSISVCVCVCVCIFVCDRPDDTHYAVI